jgi:hypothetical protein
MAADFLQTYIAAAAGSTGPHLSPVNQTTLASDCGAVLQRASSLQSYQAFLTTARAAKAQKGATLSFERTVQAQAAQAFADAQAGGAAALRVIQQVNQTSFWTDTMARLTTVLRTTGPVSAQQIWNDVWVNQTNPAIRAALQAQGLTDAVAGAVTSSLAQVNGSFVLQGGKLAVAGGAPATVTALRAPGTAPADVGELLRSAAFDQVVAAFTSGGPIYMETVPLAAAMEPAEIFAAGAIAARQHMADHVRGLQDAGLSTLAGADPLTTALLVLLVGSLVIAGIGTLLLIQCDNAASTGTEPPGGPDSCLIGQILVWLAMLVLELTAVLSGGAIQAVAALALGALMPDVVSYLYLDLGVVPGGTITGQ